MTCASQSLRWCRSCLGRQTHASLDAAVFDHSTSRAADILAGSGRESVRLGASPMKTWGRVQLLLLVDALRARLRERFSHVFYLPFIGDRRDCIGPLLQLQRRGFCQAEAPTALFIDGAERYGDGLAAMSAATRACVPATRLVYVESSYRGAPHIADAVAERMQAFRQQRSLPTLVRSAALDACALQHATELARRGALSHTGSDGTTPAQRAQRAGYAVTACGENVSIGTFEPADIMGHWLDSPTHLRNLASPVYTDYGIAFAAATVDVQGVRSMANGVCVSVFGAQAGADRATGGC
jgi:Cysteine-rich secretory protein family